MIALDRGDACMIQLLENHRRTYYWLPENTDLSLAGKARFRKGLSEDIRYNRLPSFRTSYTSCNLVGSRVDGTDDLHLPCFDVDDENKLSWFTNTWGACSYVGTALRSRTPKHWHYYLDVYLPWPAAKALLVAALPYVDSDWAKACLDQGQMFLRKPLNTAYQP